MRYIKVGGVTALAALALTAFVGAGSASADTLCESNVTICPAAQTYPVGTAFGAHAAVAQLTAGSFVVTCESGVGGVLTENPGTSSVKGEVTSLTFTNCGGSCETATAQSLPYNAEVAATGGGNGTFDAEEGSGGGNPGAVLGNCLGLGVSCTYATEKAELLFEGGAGVAAGEPAFVRAVGVPLEKTEGLFCPGTGTWTADYEVRQPEGGLWVVAEP